ncbi:MAG TPA: hypothetical protein VLF79_01975 [Candidatus Saccharimonadales bacterium]|nr:hypothetical protein [Candidatus Saccharimonadales bacterium]
MNRLKNNQKGSILLIFIITLPFLILISIYYMRLSLTSFQVARFDQLHTEAQLTADAGADYAIEQLSQDNSWTGTTSDIQVHNANNVKTKFSASVSGNSSSKTISVTGKTYWPSSRSTPARTVSIYIDLYPVVAQSFSVISGEGGLLMSNSSKIVGGDVFINGQINMSNSSQIGLSTSPATVEVADQACPQPADVTYPRVCNTGEGGQPITLNNTAHIYAAVKATNQTNGTGMSNTGLVANSTVAPQALPTYDRASQKAAIAHTLTGTSATCNGSQTQVWQANTKITGNVTISDKCKVTIQGNIWITGNLSIKNSATMIVDNGLGTSMPVVMVDGSGGAVFNNSAMLQSNASNTGFEIITFYSTASCSPDCSSVTGVNLSNSRSISTIIIDNTATAPNTIFYSYWTQVEVKNSGQLGAIIGQTVNLSNTGTITFGTSTSLGGDTTWVVKGYRRH